MVGWRDAKRERERERESEWVRDECAHCTCVPPLYMYLPVCARFAISEKKRSHM